MVIYSVHFAGQACLCCHQCLHRSPHKEAPSSTDTHPLPFSYFAAQVMKMATSVAGHFIKVVGFITVWFCSQVFITTTVYDYQINLTFLCHFYYFTDGGEVRITLEFHMSYVAALIASCVCWFPLFICHHLFPQMLVYTGKSKKLVATNFLLLMTLFELSML